MDIELFSRQKKWPEKFEDISKITSIEARVSKAAFEHGGWIAPADKPISSVAAQMSIQYAAACQCIDGQVLMAQFRHDKLNRPGDQSDAKGHADHGERVGRRVKIKFEDGTVIEEGNLAPHFVKPGLSA